MTGEQFRTEYHLLDRVSDGAVETWHAQAATGAMIMVHFLRGSTQENTALLAQLQRLESGRASRVLRTVDVDDVTAIVTRFILDFVTLEEWIHDGLMPESTLPVPAPAMPHHAPQPDPLANDPIAPADPIEADAVQPANPTHVADDAAPAPGEFTMLFKAVKPPAGDVVPVVPVPPAAAQQASNDESPRLGSMPPLGAAPSTEPPPAEPPPPAALDPAPPADAPGEFTLMFRAAGAAPPTPELPPAPPLPAVPPAPPAAPVQPAQASESPPPPRPVPPASSVPRPAAPLPPPVEPANAPGEPAAMPDWLASLQADQPADDSEPAADESEDSRSAPVEPVPGPAEGSALQPLQNATPVWSQNAMPTPPQPQPPTPLPAPQPTHDVAARTPVQRPIAPMPPAAQAPPAGEFTQMFGAAARPADMSPAAPRVQAPVPPPPAPPPAAPFGGPMSFGTPAPPAPFRPHAEPPPEPGEYTRLFGSPVLPPPPPPSMPQAPQAPPAPGAGTGALDAPGMGGSYFERLTGGAPPAAGGSPRPPSPPPTMPSPPGFTGPSEFTRVIAAVPLPGAQSGSAAPALQQTPAPAPKRASDRTLVIALAGVLIAAVIFVVVVALVG